jgi:hypothetical protein
VDNPIKRLQEVIHTANAIEKVQQQRVSVHVSSLWPEGSVASLFNTIEKEKEWHLSYR